MATLGLPKPAPSTLAPKSAPSTSTAIAKAAPPSTSKPAPSTGKVRQFDPNFLQNRYLLAMQGKPVDLLLMTGATVSGVLIKFDQFSLLMQLNSEPDRCLFYKHGVVRLRPA